MCVDFLNNSMRGTTHLEGVLDTYYTARKAAGIPNPFDITFEEYVERLIQAAQPYDVSLRQNRGCGSQSANFHSILDDESDEEEDSDDEYGLDPLLKYSSPIGIANPNPAEGRNARRTTGSTRNQERRLNNVR